MLNTTMHLYRKYSRLKHMSRSLQIGTLQASRHMQPYPHTPPPVEFKKDRRENNHPPLTTSPTHPSLYHVVLPDENRFPHMAVILYLPITISRPHTYSPSHFLAHTYYLSNILPTHLLYSPL